jgi:hypothetical protein
MNKLVCLFLGVVVFSACQKSEVVSEFTGNQTTYALQAASQYPISGTATFKERKDGTVTVAVKLNGTSAGATSPVHLHLGDITTPMASVAALLSPVIGKTGLSETRLSQLADETPVNYQQLIKLNACVKVHLSDSGAERDIILAAGNVGSATSKSIPSGRLGVAVCSSK